MKAKKIVLTTLAVVLAIVAVLAPVGLLIKKTADLEPQYTKTFYGALDEKYERLTSLEEDKIVVVGGSSVAFGLDSAMLEKYAGMPVVNFGLYADIGTKFMLDLSRDGIKEGDIVIIAPELDEQTLSLYFDGNSTLKACDDDLSMLLGTRGADDLFSVIGALWNFNRSKLEYAETGMPDPEGIYNSSSFNKYGDIDPAKYPRENNILRTYYDKAKPVELSPSIVSEDFIEYVNDYIKFCKKQGASVYFAWCPVNDLSVAKDSDISGLESFMRESVDCDFIGKLNSAIIDSHYFYDTNFHLNDSGVKIRTLRIVNELLNLWRDTTTFVEEIEEDFPAPDYKYNVIYDGPADENAKYFTFIQAENGAYTITGLTAEGKKQTTLTVPLGYDGFAVVDINTDIFAGSACEKLIITENTNLGALTGNFKGASVLRELWIYKFDESELPPPGGIEDKNADNFKIYVPYGSNYKNGYSWESYAHMMHEMPEGV